MTKENRASSNFTGGELGPEMHGRNDLLVYQNGLKTCENYLIMPEGGARFRNGSRFVQYTRFGLPAVLIPFQFSDTQAYMLEFSGNATGVLAMRVYKDGSPVLNQPLSITGITKANPAVVTIPSHGFTNGQTVHISGVLGMLEANGGYFTVRNVTTNTFSLAHPVTDANINSTAWTTYTSGGTGATVYEIASPYLVNSLLDIRFAQKDNVMYLASQSYLPRKLTRLGHASWTLSTYTRTADPFTGSDGGVNCPRAICLTPDGRLMFAGTAAAPETVWGSRTPTSSGARYDDFTLGTGQATDAVIFTLPSPSGKVDPIQWLANANRSVIVGAFSSVRRLYGASEEHPITPTSVNVKPINDYGCANAPPVAKGNGTFYIQQARRTVRSMAYDGSGESGYSTFNRTKVAKHISRSGLLQISQQKGDTDMLWGVRADGKLAALTFDDSAEVSAWSRHILGGTHVNSDSVTVRGGKVSAAACVTRSAAGEQLWVVVERVINGSTVRTIEYMTDPVEYPILEDYISADELTDSDVADFLNYTYEKQKDDCYLDASLAYDGSAFGPSAFQTAVNIFTTTTRTVSAATANNPGVFTTSTAHGYTTGDYITFSGMAGGSFGGFNGLTLQVNVLSSTTFDCGVNTTGFGTYTGSSGTVTKRGVVVNNPAVIHTASAHGFSTGDSIYVTGVGGTTQVNNQYYTVAVVNATTFTLGVNGSAWTTYTSGGTVAKSGITVDPAAGATTVGSTGVQFVASSPFWTSSPTMIGREIRKKYDVNGDGGGRAVITGFTSTTIVTATILSAFDNANVIAAGNWYLTADTLYGGHHLAGATVDVVADGAVIAQKTVSAAGVISLGAQYSKVFIGYKYYGRMIGMNLDIGGTSGPAEAKPRQVTEVASRFLNTLGMKVGVNAQDLDSITFVDVSAVLERVNFTADTDQLGRPSPPFSGIKITNSRKDRWSRKDKNLTYLHDTPTPSTVLTADVFMKTTDENEQQGFARGQQR